MHTLARGSFEALFEILLERPEPPPSTLTFALGTLSPEDIRARGTITSGHLRALEILLPSPPFTSLRPDLLGAVDWSTFRGVEELTWVLNFPSSLTPEVRPWTYSEDWLARSGRGDRLAAGS